jgi:hypothetical protein
MSMSIFIALALVGFGRCKQDWICNAAVLDSVFVRRDVRYKNSHSTVGAGICINVLAVHLL